MRIVIAAVAALRHRQPAELRAPDHQRGIEQAALLQVLQQPGDRLIGHAAHLLVVADQVLVRVPLHRDRAAAGVKLHEADAALHQPPRQQTARAELARVLLVQAVQLPRCLGFLR